MTRPDPRDWADARTVTSTADEFGRVKIAIFGEPEAVARTLLDVALKWSVPDEVTDDLLEPKPAGDLDVVALTARLVVALRRFGAEWPWPVEQAVELLWREVRTLNLDCAYCGSPSGAWCRSKTGRPTASHQARRQPPPREPRRP